MLTTVLMKAVLLHGVSLISITSIHLIAVVLYFNSGQVNQFLQNILLSVLEANKQALG